MIMRLRMKPEIQTVSGRRVSLVCPEPDSIVIEDIAHALSNLCRFTGHTRYFYSVAQHSVMVSRIVPPEHAFAGLMHDAAEAYVGDISIPLKSMLANYRALEQIVHRAIFLKFGLDAKMPECVRYADLVMLATEKRDLLGNANAAIDWGSLDGVVPLVANIAPWTNAVAKYAFERRFMELWKSRSGDASDVDADAAGAAA